MSGRLSSSRPYPGHVFVPLRKNTIPGTLKDIRMNTYAVRTAHDTVRIERTLPGPIERVWAYLTEDEKRSQWFASGTIEPRVGGRVELLFKHSRLSDEPGAPPPRYADMEPDGYRHESRVTAWEPPHLLGYIFGEDDEVRLELAERGDEVLLTLTHSRIASRERMVQYSGGWHAHLEVLADRLNGRAPPNFWTLHTPLEAEYEKRFAAS